MPLRACAQPGCPALVRSGRCAKHRKTHERERGSRQARGYDATHDRLRADYQRQMDRGKVFVCWRPNCDEVIDPEHWHLGHDPYDRSIYRGPECPPCNLSDRP